MSRSTFDPTTKKAALFSGLLHLFALLFLVLAVVFSSLFAREEEPHIFEMVALPVSDQLMEELTMDPMPELTVDIPEVEPVEITPPEPEPEPVRETPPPPKPQPQPVVERTPPPPVPVEKPKPKPEPKPEPEPERKIITLDQFQQEHGKIEAPKNLPKPKPSAPRRTIDTSEIEKNIQKAVGSVPEMSVTTPTTTVDTDAMKTWRGILAARLDALWKQIDTKGTAGREVRISFYISAGGAISSVKIIRSSGIPQLDSQAIQTVQRLGSFVPPPSGKGETVNVPFKVE